MRKAGIIDANNNLHALSTPANQTAERMYLDALNEWNAGNETYSRHILHKLKNQFPDFTPTQLPEEQLG